LGINNFSRASGLSYEPPFQDWPILQFISSGSMTRIHWLELKGWQPFVKVRQKPSFKPKTSELPLNHNPSIAPGSGDITYIFTAPGLALSGRSHGSLQQKIIGWSTAHHLKSSLVQQAMLQAIRNRPPKSGQEPLAVRIVPDCAALFSPRAKHRACSPRHPSSILQAGSLLPLEKFTLCPQDFWPYLLPA